MLRLYNKIRADQEDNIMDRNYDVIVAGGGFGGIGAAIAAAREGMKVLLIEQSGALGGAASNCLVLPYMSNKTMLKNADGKVEHTNLSQGIFKEIIHRLTEMGQYNDYNGAFNMEYLKVILDRLVKEYGVEILFHSTIASVASQGRKIHSVDVATVAGIITFKADCFIDATGDANLSALAGCNFQLGREEDSLCQPMTLCFRVMGVSWEDICMHRAEMNEVYQKFQKEGKIKNPRENILLFETMVPGEVHFNTTRVIKRNPTNPFDVSQAEMEGREQMIEMINFLKENIPIFKEAQLTHSAISIGVRESRMVEGEHCLTGEEMIATTKFPDAIAAGKYEIDIHNPEGSGTYIYQFPQGEYYTIPFRSLVAKDFDNLLVAGRCISCDHSAQASLRIMPICCTTGEAAGVGAAVTVKQKCAVKDSNVDEIRNILLSHEAFIE